MAAEVLLAKRFIKNSGGGFPDRYHYLSNDGLWIKSFNSDGEESKVPATPEPGANESFIWDGSDKAFVWPNAEPFDVKILCIVDPKEK